MINQTYYNINASLEIFVHTYIGGNFNAFNVYKIDKLSTREKKHILQTMKTKLAFFKEMRDEELAEMEPEYYI